jgi:hypothetical protein
MALLLALPAAGQGPAWSDGPAIAIDERAFSAKERQLIRDGATVARAFFRSHGVDVQETIRVDARKPDDSDRLPHIGAYSLQNKTIAILTLEQALRQNRDHTLFGLPLDEGLYRSVVVHEMAHAIAEQNFAIADPSLVAQEYLAYVAQLATLESGLREKILRGFELSPYEGIDEMSSVYYQMAPACFGVKAYLHFATLQDPGVFIRGLLSGSIAPANPEME